MRLELKAAISPEDWAAANDSADRFNRTTADAPIIGLAQAAMARIIAAEIASAIRTHTPARGERTYRLVIPVDVKRALDAPTAEPVATG